MIYRNVEYFLGITIHFPNERNECHPLSFVTMFSNVSFLRKKTLEVIEYVVENEQEERKNRLNVEKSKQNFLAH